MESKNPFGPMWKIFKAWEKYFWDQSIFKTMALNMEGVIAENNQNPAQRGFKQPVSRKQILLINQISLQTPILGEGNKSFLKKCKFLSCSLGKMTFRLASTVGRGPPWDTSAGQEMTAGALDHDSEELKVPKSLKKLYLLIYIEVMKVLLKSCRTHNESLDLNSRVLGGLSSSPPVCRCQYAFLHPQSHSVTGIWCDPPSVLNSGWEPGQNPFHRNLGLSQLSLCPDDWACKLKNCWSLYFPSCWPRI